MKKVFYAAMATSAIFLGFSSTMHAASYADVVFVVDQSGSMWDEFQWLGNSISTINTSLVAGGVTAKYGVAGYEYDAGSAYLSNAWVDLTSDISAVTSEVNWAASHTYGGTERGYQAADWAANNFTWTGSNYAKVMILVTDEPNDDRANYSYGSLTGEAALAKKMADSNILLNVITYQTYYQYWNEAVYTKGTYAGLFDLSILQNNPSQFTADFTAAKLKEIQDYNPPGVPEPTTMLLFGTGLAGLAAVSRRRLK